MMYKAILEHLASLSEEARNDWASENVDEVMADRLYAETMPSNTEEMVYVIRTAIFAAKAWQN